MELLKDESHEGSFIGPGIIMTIEEAQNLWNFLKWQHLPYNNPELQKCVRELGDICEPVKFPDR